MSGAAAPLVRYDREGAVARITLNRPDKLNAFNDQMVRDLAAALRRFDLDDDAMAAVLIGAGRAFSAGADVRERQARPAAELATLPSPEAWDADSTQLLTRAVHWKPVVAAVHGYVLGMAVGLAVECELIVAATDVKFQITETVRGLPPGGIRATVRARRHRIREINERCRYDNELHRLHLSPDFAARVSGFIAGHRDSAAGGTR